MISDIWTLEPHGTPGDASTLAARGVTTATIDWPNQAAGTLSLTIAADDVGGADVSIYTYKSRWVLRRDGDVFFRGRVRSVPRKSGDGSVTIEIVDAWDDLARTPYLQAWDVIGSDGSITSQSTPRALLSDSSGRKTAAECLTTVLAAYNEVATVDLTLSVNLNTSLLGGGIGEGGGAANTRYLPPIEAANLSCAALIRRILEFHPGASAYLVYGAATDTLRVVDRTLAPAISHAVGTRPLADFDLVRRDDQVVDAVHVYYEASATRFATVEGTDGDPDTIRATRRLAIFADKYPAGSSITDQTLVVTLQAPAITNPPAPPMPQMVPIKTRPIPVDGATNADAQKWWLDMLGLSVFGLTAADVFLPASSAEGQTHRVRFAWAVDDPNDPLYQAPSAINPNSTVVWRPASVTDLPRMLTSGTLAEWMKVEAAELAIDATVYLKKSSVDADAALKKAVLAMSPRVGVLGSEPAYIVDREVRVMGTTAKTKVYRNWAATGTASPSADTATSLEESRLEAVVPNLAHSLYLDRATAPWEGTVPIVEEECGLRRYLGKVLNLTHPDRPEWLTMKAQVQRERLDLTQGTTTVTVGPPGHLSPQDRAALWQASRTARAERAQAAQSAPPPTSTESDDDLTNPGRGGVFPGTVAPIREVKSTAPGEEATRRLWDPEVVDAAAAQIKIRVPGVVRKSSDVDSTGKATITDIGATFTMAEDDYLCLTVEADGTTVKVEKLATWTDFPFPWKTTTDANGFKVMDKGHFPLLKVIAVPDPMIAGLHYALNDTLAMVRMAPDAHFDIYDELEETPTGEFIKVKTLKPGWGAY